MNIGDRMPKYTELGEPMTDYAELRAATDAVKPGDGDTMLAYRLASGPTVIRALLAERDAFADVLEAIASIKAAPGRAKADALLASVVNLASAALAQNQGD